MNAPFYDIYASYEENFEKGPTGLKKFKPPKRKISPKHKFLGFPINLPFGIPAGPLLNSKFIKGAFDFGFDVNHYKTQRSVHFPVNQFPNVLFVNVNGNLTLKKADKPLLATSKTNKSQKDFSITNSFGNPSKGPDFWQKDMKKSLNYEKKGQLLIASVVGTIQRGFDDEDYYNDFAKSAKLAKDTGVKVIEINLSCPNVANEGILCYSVDTCYKISKLTKEAIENTPLLVKVGYYSKDQDELLKKIINKISPFISGIVAINTIPAPVVDDNGNQALPGPNRLKSGICGASIKWAGIDMVKRLARIREKLRTNYEIVGVGGVMNVRDYNDYRKAGADLVQSATGAMWNPYLAQEIFEQEK